MCSGHGRERIGPPPNRRCVRHRPRHAALKAPVLFPVHLPSWGGFAQALGKRMLPWPPLSFTVLAQASSWRCSCSPSRVLGFRAHQHRSNESAPPLAPRWFESTKRVVRAPAKLGRLHPCPRQANAALASALLHRAGAGSDVSLLVFSVACTGVSHAPTPKQRECATACATLV